MATTMNPTTVPNPNGAIGSTNQDSKQGLLNSVPAWGSYLYQNFLMPAFSPSEWLNSNTPSSLNTNDYFGVQPTSFALPSTSSRGNTNPNPYAYAAQPQQTQQQQHNPNPYFQQSYYNHQQPASAIPTSLLQSMPSSSNISPSVDIIDNLVRSPSPVSQPHQLGQTPQGSPKRGAKRRASSMDSADSHEHDDAEEHDIAEGVERDGMIWGMRVEDYRALSARERKRVRNRISARTFRAKRKEHLSSLEMDLENKDIQIKAANEESARLREQVADLQSRLAKYERV